MRRLAEPLPENPMSTVPTAAQIAQNLERAARVVAPAVALVITCTVLLTELAYQLGYQLGAAVHARNAELSAVWRRLWVPNSEPAAAPITVKPAPIRLAPQLQPLVHPLAELAADLETLTCSQLRSLAGTRRKARKAELIAMVLA
jgi:hypothetical protein